MNKARDTRIETPVPGVTFLGTCLAIYLFLSAFDFVAILPGVSISRVSAILLILLFVVNAKKMALPRSISLLTMFAFMLFALIVLLLMNNPQRAITGLFSYTLNAIVFLCAVSLPFTNKDIKLMEGALVAAALCLCVLMFTNASSVGSDWVTERTVVNIAGSQQDPNMLCGYFLFAIGYCTYRVFKSNKFYLLVFICLFFYVVMATGSRGGLAAATVTLLVGIAFGFNRTKYKSIYILIIAVFLVGAYFSIDFILSLLPSSVAERFANFSLSGGSGSLRLQAWKDVLQAYASSDWLHQLLGHGYGATTTVTFNGLVAHNTFLEVLYSFGFLGLVSFVAFLGSGLYAAWKVKDYSLLAGLVGIIVLLMTLTDSASKTLWGYLMVAVVQYEMMRRGKPEQCQVPRDE